MPVLARLHKQMTGADRLRVQFDYTHPNNGAQFTVMFLADTEPYALVLAAKGVNPFIAVFRVTTEFEVEPWISDFGRLMDVLGVRPGKSSFKATDFLRQVSAAAPKDIRAAKDASPAVLVRIHRDVEEADKIYFRHFVNHGTSGRHVTLQNLDKTRRLLGVAGYTLCRDRNLSSAWSADPAEEKPYRVSIAKIVDDA